LTYEVKQPVDLFRTLAGKGGAFNAYEHVVGWARRFRRSSSLTVHEFALQLHAYMSNV
jgi:hypothetical protein